LMLTLVCYLFPQWRWASFVSAAVIAPSILILLIMPESPTWFLSKGRMEEMRRSERWIARLSGQSPDSASSTVTKQDYEQCDQQNLLALVQNPALFRRLVVLWPMWMVAALSSYTLDFSSGQISGNLFVNQAFISVLISASKGVLILLDRRMPNFSRRHLHQFAQSAVMISFAALVATLLLAGNKSLLVIVIYCICTPFVEYSWDACSLCTIESMPTSLRSSALGSCSLLARVGAILAPVLLSVGEVWEPGPYAALFGIGAANLLLSYCLLVDTKNVDLAKVRLDQQGGQEDRPEEIALGRVMNGDGCEP